MFIGAARKPRAKKQSEAASVFNLAANNPGKKYNFKSVTGWNEFAKEKGLKLYEFRNLDQFMKFMIENQNTIFGTKVTSKGWFNLVDKYPVIMDVVDSTGVDIDVLLEEDTAEKYWKSVAKKYA